MNNSIKTNLAVAVATVALIANGVMAMMLHDKGAFEPSDAAKIRVVDIAALTSAAQEKLRLELEAKIQQEGAMMDSDTINALAQVEAAKLFEHINRVAGNHDLVFSKNTVIKGPDNIDITHQIATDLGMTLN